MGLVRTPEIHCSLFGQAHIGSNENQCVIGETLVLDSREPEQKDERCTDLGYGALVECFCNKIYSDGGLFAYPDH